MKRSTVLMTAILGFITDYAEAHSVSMAYGMNGFIGAGKETTWGTAVAATDYVESMSENMHQPIDRYETDNIINRIAEPQDMDGMRRVMGDTVFSADPLFLGLALKSAMNTVSGSTVLSGFLYTTRFVSPQGDFASGVPGTPYTLEIFRDVTSSHRYAGCMVDKLLLALAPNQDLRVTASWIGRSHTMLTKSTPTFTGSPVMPFTFDTASISIAGAGSARLEACSVLIDNQLAGIAALNQSTTVARIYRKGPQTVRLKGTLDFPDITEYNDFINQTQRAFVLNILKASSFQLNIVIPQFVYTAFPMGMPGRDRLTVQFEGRAQFLPSSNTAIDFQLTNTRSNY